LLHILAHALGKTALFLGSGELLHAEGTTQIGSVRGLLTRRPALAALFAAGLVAIAGLPPFGLFASEVALVRAGFASDLGWVMAIALVLVLVVFAMLLVHGQRMLLGDDDDRHGAAVTPRGPLAPIALGLVALAVLGITIYPIESLLHAAARVVTP
jgi:hydrogenase-4 component F